MVKCILRSLTVILVLSVLTFALLILSGCKDDDSDTVKVGIDVDKDDGTDTVTEQTKTRARTVIEKLVSLYYRKSGERLTVAEIEAVVAKTLELTLAEGLTEHKYSAMIGVLEESGEEFVSAAVATLDGDFSEDAVNTIGNVYFKLTEEVDAGYFGSVAYGICIMSYERKIEKHIAAGTAVGNVRARQLTEKKETVINHIGKESFSELLRLTFFLRGFFATGSLDPDAAERFTDAELLVFIKEIDLSGIKIGKEGYKLLADYYSDSLFGKETTYFQELIYAANNNGDIDLFAGAMEDAIKLASKIISRFTEADVALLRTGDGDGLVKSVFAGFTDEEWTLFERITDLSVKNAKYSKIATEFFGDDFTQYASSNSPVSLTELRAAVGTDGFMNSLEGYIFGISPAFSYGMNK